MQCTFVNETGSTNQDLYIKGLNCPNVCDEALAALKQTSGKGRRGRSFFSPDDTGIYLSLLLHPDCNVSEATLITTIMAVASAKALEEFSKDDIQIKWVNDLYKNGKKIGGILTECSANIVNEKPDYVVVGIGINVFPPIDGFPEEISNKAGSLFDTGVEKASLDAATELRKNISLKIIDEFEKLYASFPTNEHHEEYVKRSFIIGKKVQIVNGPMVEVMSIGSNFELIVKDDAGNTRIINSGEVSLIV